MANTKVDRRVRKSEAAMAEALLALMEQKPLAQITVRELVDEADVNRSTFYRHYLDIPDMTERLGDELIEGIHAILLEYKDNPGTGIPAECVTEVFEYLQENRRMFLALEGAGGDMRFPRAMDEMLKAYAHEHLWPKYGIGASDPRLPLIFSFFMTGLFALMREWLAGDYPQDAAYFGRLASALDTHAQAVFREVPMQLQGHRLI